MQRILLADDHAVVRRGIKQIISQSYPQVIFGEAQSLQVLREMVAHEQWEIIIMDLSFPEGNGLDALKQIKKDYPQIPILILTMYPEDQYALRTIRAGASGYLNKESAPEELVQAIQNIFSGGEYISPQVTEQLVDYARHEKDQPLYKYLSDREYEVLCLIASGKGLKDISTDLSLSPKTVSTYRSRLLSKLNLKTNADLTLYAIQHDLVMKGPS